MSKITWHLEEKALSDLNEFPDNPRRLNKKGMADLKRSIETFGCAEPVVINVDGTICGGHGRKKTLESMGVDKVDCYMPSRELTEDEFKELNVRLNKNVAGEFDFDILANKFDMDKLLDWGFEEKDFGISTVLGEEDDFDVPVGGSNTDIVLGDLFEIGPHKLLCGNSTMIDEWNKLCGNELIDLVVTDPPYNVDYVGKTKNALKIENDKKTDGDFYQFLYDFYTAACAFVKGGGRVVCVARGLGGSELSPGNDRLGNNGQAMLGVGEELHGDGATRLSVAARAMSVWLERRRGAQLVF